MSTKWTVTGSGARTMAVEDSEDADAGSIMVSAAGFEVMCNGYNSSIVIPVDTVIEVLKRNGWKVTR